MTEMATLYTTSQSVAAYRWRTAQKSFGSPNLKTKVTLGVSAAVGSLLLMEDVAASTIEMATKVVDGLPSILLEGEGATTSQNLDPILSAIKQDAILDKSPVPTPEAFSTACCVVERLRAHPCHKEIEAYAGANENVIIDSPYGPGRSVVAICAASGGLTVLFRKDGEDLQKSFERYDLAVNYAFAELLEQLDS